MSKLELVIQERGEWSTEYPEYNLKATGKWYVLVDNKGTICGLYPSKQMAALAIKEVEETLKRGKADEKVMKYYQEMKRKEKEDYFKSRNKNEEIKNAKNDKRIFHKKEKS